jgi:hypothetical protein
VVGLDPSGNVDPTFSGGVTVSLVSSDGATLLGPLTQQGVGGYTTFSNLSIDEAGSGYTLQVSSSGLSGTTTSSFSVTATTATHLAISSMPPAHVTAGAPFTMAVQAEDTYGNLATSFTGPVTIALTNKQAGVLNGNLTESASNGVITFPGVTMDITGSSYTILASSVGLKSATTTTIAVAPAAAAMLVVSAQPPSSLKAGAEFGLVVEAKDAYGNIASGFTGGVTLSLTGPSGPTTLSGGPLSVSAIGGIANFPPTLAIDTAGSGYTIQASSGGLAPVTTGAINITGLTSTHLAVTVQPPSSVAPGGSFGFVVAAEDQYGNPDPNFNGQISIALPAGSGVSLGGVTTVAAVGGLATFQGLTLSGAATPVSIQVTSSSLPGTSTNLVGLTTSTTVVTEAQPVMVTSIQLIKVKVKHKTSSEILIGFSGGLNATEAASTGEYSMIQAGKKNSFTARNARKLGFLSAVYNPASHTVTLTPQKKLAANKLMELIIDGQPPSGLQDSNGQLIDGNRNGQPGSNATAVLKGKTVSITSAVINPATVDLLLEQNDLALPGRKSR